MAIRFDEITSGKRLAGVVAGHEVVVIALEWHGSTSATLTYKPSEGPIDQRLLSLADLTAISAVDARRWTFDADGAMFRLASEARRMKWAHLADPFVAVETSNIEPYPHQIDAVYNRFLVKHPLRFVLADDPGAGKTIMAGLLIRELMLRGDVARCLIVAPGSLVEQWQDELGDKFGLDFEIMSREKVESSRIGNPFLERDLLVARLDQLSRAEDLTAKLEAATWDLVIVDEAHKMSAHRYGNKLNETKRFKLGKLLGDRTRHLLLLTATPHNGKDDDFLAFMTLIDPHRFTGRLRNGEMPAVDDVMRRLVKENLTTFDGRRLFTQRSAHSVNFKLSALETELYEAVTSYVRHGMNRAARMREEGDKRRGIIVGFALAGLQRRLASSPAAIYHSLRRRHERLTAQAEELRRLAASGEPVRIGELPKGVRIADLVDIDLDDYGDDELEDLENLVIDAASAAETADELEAELVDLAELVRLAERVRRSQDDTKWQQLRGLLRSEEFRDVDGLRKLIVFSEHKDTLSYVAERIANELGRPEAVVTIHGGVKRHERRDIQDRFRVDPTVRVLVATDAAGEGVNLQVANLMVNYDLPWNPNRIEQRFGRIHRIGQTLPCHLWNLVAHETREGQVFRRLFEKIEQQRVVFGDQVYDVLGDSHINTALHDLLLRAIREDEDPAQLSFMDEVIESDIGAQLTQVLKERALVEIGTDGANDKIRDLMERAKARKLQPWFVEAFFTEALRQYKGRITGREAGRFEITRIPATIRARADRAKGLVHDRYARVTFDKDRIIGPSGERAELISPGTALLAAVVDQVLADHGATLQAGATLVAPDDQSSEPRLLVYLDHVVTDGRIIHGHRQVVSRRFQYVEIDKQGHARDQGSEPYIGYAPLSADQQTLLAGRLDDHWVNHEAEVAARDWAIEHLAGPHFAEVSAVTSERVTKVREAVRERLTSEITYWDKRAAELRQQPSTKSAQAQSRADEFESRLARRRLDLDHEADLHNNPPTIVGAALIIPQGLLDELAGQPPDPQLVADTAQTDRRAVAAVMAVEKKLGRVPTEQEHNNPGFDIESIDPTTGIHYFIEVKGHLRQTTEVKISTPQVQKAKSNPLRWRLAVVSVPDDLDIEPTVRYLIEPFADVNLHFAQTGVPLDVATLIAESGEPQ